MKKRLLYGICLTFLIVFCTGCSGNIKSEKEMLQDMTDEMKTIFITQDGETQNIQLEPQSLKITKEDKNKETKDDTIYATIELKNDTYSFINVNIKMYIFDHLRMYIFAILPLDRYIFLSDKIFL